jgi:trans-2,3-dihydro-3-hydroxyanthranilate isomerase
LPDIRVRFLVCDVFTNRRFGGNQLAVVPEASGLSDVQMQQIAREFNFSESAFVFPSVDDCTRRVRIFTPATEVPFAGHPNVGTAFVLASIGDLGEVGPRTVVTFDEKAGRVPVEIHRDGADLRCVVTAPRLLSVEGEVDRTLVSAALSLTTDDIVTSTHPPQLASVGLPFVFVEVRDRDALARARIDMGGFDAIRATGVVPDIFLYARSDDGYDVRARMFAPFDGVPEDPATGSAAACLGGLLSHYNEVADGTLTWRITQGVEMSRASALVAEADKTDGHVVATRVGGHSVLVCDGHILID